MKRRKKPEPGPAVRVNVIVVEEPANPDELLERYRTLAVADARRAAEFRRKTVKAQKGRSTKSAATITVLVHRGAMTVVVVRVDSASHGPKKAAEIIRSFCEASEMQPREVIARVRTFLMTYDPDHLTLH